MFTYSGDPSASDLDAVRFLISDTNSADAELQDEEINYLLTTWANTYDAAVAACEVVAGRYADRTNYSRSVGDLSISESYGQAASEFRALAQRLRAQKVLLNPPTPKINPQSIRPTREKTETSYKSDFYTGLMDNNS